MPQQVFGAEAAVSMVNRALANTSPAHTVYLNQVAAAGTTDASQYAFAAQLGAQYAVGKTAADLSALLLGNMGVSNDILQAALTDYIAFHGTQNIGIIALQLGQILSGLEGDVTFGAAAAKWNQEVTNAYQYSSSSFNNTPQTGDDGIGATTLTRFTDVVVGHEIRGYMDYNQFTGRDEQTLTTSDRITGTDAADDILFAQMVQAALGAAATRPTLNGIEIVSIDVKGGTPTLDMADANGVKTIMNVGSAEAAGLTFANLKNLVDVVVRNTNANTTVTFNATVVAGADDAVNLTVDGAGVRADRANITINSNGANDGVETLNITASGAASVLGNVTSANVTKLTVAGDQNLSVGTKVAAAGFTSTVLANVDASAATGNLFLNVSAAGATNQTITTGAGNDTVVMRGLTANDTVDLGAGTNRVVLTDTGSNQAAKLTNVQEIEARVAGTSLNLVNAPSVNLIAVAETAVASSIANVTSVKSGTTFAFEGEGAANTVGLVNTATFGNVRFNLANATGSTDVINVTYNNDGAMLGTDGQVTIGTLNNSGNNVETMNLTFSDVGADDTVSITDIQVGTALRTLNVTSDSRVTLGTGLNDLTDLTGLTSVDASAVKGAFNATFGLLADTASALVKTGGAGNNNVAVAKGDADGATGTTLTVDASAGTGNQTFTVNNTDADVTGTTPSFVFMGGSGNDTLTLTSAVGSVNNISGGKGVDTINLTLSAGVDHLVFNVGDSMQGASDVITGFKAGPSADLIDLRSFGFDVALQNVTATGAALNGTANEFGGNAVVAAAIGGNTTVYVDVNGDNKFDANDLVISFVGAAVVNTDILWA